ncbi:hypothetical protein HDV05_000103 [Chytridiales sp. JEL 0842]|nr:hypothetical protein HDV05_000103 [Chytridiales sp. JEL 0842]
MSGSNSILHEEQTPDIDDEPETRVPKIKETIVYVDEVKRKISFTANIPPLPTTSLEASKPNTTDAPKVNQSSFSKSTDHPDSTAPVPKVKRGSFANPTDTIWFNTAMLTQVTSKLKVGDDLSAPFE